MARFLSAVLLVLLVWFSWRIASKPSAEPRAERLQTASTKAPSISIPERAPHFEVSSASISRQAPSIPKEEVALPRVEAKKWLRDFIAEHDTSIGPFPEVDLHPEDSASPLERSEIQEARRVAQLRGHLLLVARLPDGTLHFMQSGGDFPRSFFPAHVRKNLTEEDWEGFQIAMNVIDLKKSVLSILARRMPNKALEPTPTAVTDRAAHAPRQP